MKRDALPYLLKWKVRKNRKPMVIRGARQVGKTFLVRQFAKESGLELFEINLEQQDDFVSIFKSKDPFKIISLLEIKIGRKIKSGKSLIFLDEIQVSPQVLATLRYFYEQIPELHVIATGSLLDFILEEHSFSMPVGRIEYLHLGPFKFKEFLLACGFPQLSNYLEKYSLDEEFQEVVHQELMKYYKLYLVIGGMPEAIKEYTSSHSLLSVNAIQQSIILTYRDDFNKYRKKMDLTLLQTIYQKLPSLVGQKIKYTSFSREEKSATVKNTLELLRVARVYNAVYHSSSNGIPLKAEENKKFEKPLFLDVGLMNKACGLSYLDIEEFSDIELVNTGSVSEQFIGQHLLYRQAYFEEPELHYWCREKSQSSAEVDYMISVGRKIIPIEVKSGSTGSLKSLCVFLNEKKLEFAVRFNADRPSQHSARMSLPGVSKKFDLLSLPLYMVEETLRLIRESSRYAGS